MHDCRRERAAPRRASCTDRARGACSAAGDPRSVRQQAGSRSVVGDRELTATVAVRQEHRALRRLESAVGAGDHRDAHTRRRPRRGRLLQHAFDRPIGDRRADDERVLGTVGSRRDGRQHRAHCVELAERRAHLVDEVRARRAEPSASASRSNHHDGTVVAGSAATGTYCTNENWRGDPIAPSATARASVTRSSAHRNSCPTSATTPARVAASSIVRASPASSANGFSQMT